MPCLLGFGVRLTWLSNPVLSFNSDIKFGRFLTLSFEVSVISKKLMNLAMIPQFIRSSAGTQT